MKPYIYIKYRIRKCLLSFRFRLLEIDCNANKRKTTRGD